METIRPEDRLDGSSNFNKWEERLMAILEENDIDHYVTSVVEEPSSNAGRTTYKKNQEKARRIIYNYVKENLMPVITPLKIAKECFETLVKLYEPKAPSEKRLLKNQLCTLKMEKDEYVNCFFTKISQFRDQLLSIGIIVDDDDLVQITVDGISPSWEAFLVVVNGCDVHPNFERLWHDFMQEGRVQNKNCPSQEENISLATSTNKWKGKRFSHQKRKGKNFKGEWKLNMSKIKCYNCNKMGHYVKDCYRIKEGEYFMHLMLMLMKNLEIKEQGNSMMSSDPDRRRRKLYSSHLFPIPSPITWRLGWWTLGLRNI